MPISKVYELNQGDEELMKNITKRKDGRLMGRKQINGQIVYVYAHSVQECLTKLKRAIKEALKNPKVKKVTYKLFNWLSEWYSNYVEPFIKYKSAKIVESVIKEVKKNFEDINLTDITTHRLQSFMNLYQPSRKKEFIFTYFNACLQKAEDIMLIQRNPFKAVKRDKKLNVVRKPFNLIEQEKILKAIKGTEIEPVILFYLCTGIRKNELNVLNIQDDINVEKQILRVKSEKKRNNIDVYREIDITKELIELVLNNLKSFTLTTNQIYRRFKTILDELNIKGSLHSLRHTFATNQFYLGTPAKQVQVWLGHEKIELTQNIYTHIDRSITKEDILKLYNNLYYKF